MMEWRKVTWAWVGLVSLVLEAPGAMVIDGVSVASNERFANDPSFIADSYALSGIGRSVDVSSGKWGTLVSPNVFISAFHYHPEAGDSLTFHESNDPAGASQTRTVLSGLRIGSSDVWLGVLDASLPASYPPIPFINEAILSEQAFEASSLFNQEAFMVGRFSDTPSTITNVAVGKNRVDQWFPSVSPDLTTDSAIGAIEQVTADSGFVTHEAFLQIYDSGAPLLMDLNGVLTIIGLNWFVGEVDLDSRPRFVDLRNVSGFSYVGNYALPVQAVIDAFAVDTTAAYFIWMDSAFGGVSDWDLIGPAIDFDGDGLINFVEYAFGLDPASSANPVPAVAGKGESGGSSFAHIQFSAREDSQLQYSVRVGSDLIGWSTINLSFSGGVWSSGDVSQVTIESAIDLGGGIWALTVQDTVPLIPGSPRFLAVAVD